MNKKPIEFYTVEQGLIIKHKAETIELKDLQNVVGGLIEPVYTDWSNELTIYANEEALNMNLEPNIFIKGNLIRGNIIIIGIDRETTEPKTCTVSISDIVALLTLWQQEGQELIKDILNDRSNNHE